jgi:hypothetical protein
MIEQLIQQAEQQALTGSEVTEMSGGYRAILYQELAGYQSIDDLLHGDQAIIILYQVTHYSGHWICIIDYDSYIEVFDSYGFAPDEELKLARYIETPLLSILLSKDGHPIVYNKKRLQKMNNNINDCGRFVALRLRFIDLPLESFVQLVNNDRMATMMTLIFKH